MKSRTRKAGTLIAAESVGAYDAKTHLSKLLERTERGERLVITRHGRPVAQLIPFRCFGGARTPFCCET